MITRFASRCLASACGAVIVLLTLAPLAAVAVLGQTGSSAMWSDPDWVAAGLRTLLLAEAAVPLALLLGLPAALGIWDAPRTPRRLVLGAACLPLLVPSGWTATGLVLAADRSGIAGAHLTALIAAHVAPAASVVLLVLTAVLNQLDVGLLASARAAGAGPFTAWRLVVLPALGTPVLWSCSAAFAVTIGQALADTLLAPRHHPTLAALLASAIRAGDSQAGSAGLVLGSVALMPLCLLGGLSLLRHPLRA